MALDYSHQLREERDSLGKAIGEAAFKAGIIDSMQPLTGPQLIQLCDDLARGNQKIIDLLYRIARHLRNTDDLPPLRWGVEGMNLLVEIRELNVEKYDKEVKGSKLVPMIAAQLIVDLEERSLKSSD